MSLPDFGEDWAAREGEICGQSLGWLRRRMSVQWGAQNWSKETGSLLAAFALVLTHGSLMIRALTLFFLDPSGFLSAPTPSSVLFLKWSVCCSRRFTNSCQPGLQHPESSKGRNLGHKINRLRVQVPQGDSRPSCLHTGEGSGGGRVGWGCGEVQVPVTLALKPGHQVGHTVSARCP